MVFRKINADISNMKQRPLHWQLNTDSGRSRSRTVTTDQLESLVRPVIEIQEVEKISCWNESFEGG